MNRYSVRKHPWYSPFLMACLGRNVLKWNERDWVDNELIFSPISHSTPTTILLYPNKFLPEKKIWGFRLAKALSCSCELALGEKSMSHQNAIVAMDYSHLKLQHACMHAQFLQLHESTHSAWRRVRELDGIEVIASPSWEVLTMWSSLWV
jgi:hypothetical protein